MQYKTYRKLNVTLLKHNLQIVTICYYPIEKYHFSGLGETGNRKHKENVFPKFLIPGLDRDVQRPSNRHSKLQMGKRRPTWYQHCVRKCLLCIHLFFKFYTAWNIENWTMKRFISKCYFLFFDSLDLGRQAIRTTMLRRNIVLNSWMQNWMMFPVHRQSITSAKRKNVKKKIL